MKTRLILLATPLFLLLTSAAMAAPPNMQAGMWEITTTSDMPGMQMKMPPQTMRQCYKAENMKDAKETIPVDKSCKMDDFKQNGNTVNWKVNCKTEGVTMVGTGEITYAGQSYSGKMTVKGNAGGMAISMVSQYSAKRVGDCK